MNRRIGAMSVVAVMALVACGGGSSSSASSGSTSSSAAPAVRTAEQLAADQAIADAVILQLVDFPQGWASKPRGPSTSDTPEAKAAESEFATCLAVDPALVTDEDDTSKAKAKSEKFSDGDLDADMTASVDVSRDDALAGITAFQDPKAPDCLRAFMGAAIKYALEHPDPGKSTPPGLSFGDLEVSPLDLNDLHGESVAFRVKMPISAAGITINFFGDFVFALKGRTGMTFTFSNVNEPFRSDLEVQLANIAIDRAPDN